MGQSHFRNAEDLYNEAVKVNEMDSSSRLPSPNPEMRSPGIYAFDRLCNAETNLEYAEQLGGVDKEAVKSLREKIDSLMPEVKRKRNEALEK